MRVSNNKRIGERGNVLFLILIAVALFAALSYAVTQSTRSGGGSTERERAVLSGAAMTQYPTGMRTSIIRMILGGVDVSAIKFNSPTNFGVLDSRELVFHPSGGGATFQSAPADLMVGNTQGSWAYNAHWQVPQVGTDGAGGNDLIAFLPGVTQGICEQVNNEFVINITDCATTNGDVPDLATAATEANIDEYMDDAYVFSTTNASAQEDLQGEDSGGTCEAFTGQPSGCFYDGTRYVFYSVLLER